MLQDAAEDGEVMALRSLAAGGRWPPPALLLGNAPGTGGGGSAHPSTDAFSSLEERQPATRSAAARAAATDSWERRPATVTRDSPAAATHASTFQILQLYCLY